MSVRSTQPITVLFTTRVFATGVATNADSTPTGTLYVNGTPHGATVTVTNVTTGLYKASVTLPSLAIGDIVDLRINATVSTITDNAVIWRDTRDIALDNTGAVNPDWGAQLPGPYGSGSAGYEIGNYLNAAVSSRSTFAGGAVTSVTNPVTVGGYAAGQDPATLVLDTSASAHTGVNTVGERIYNAGSAGSIDPLAMQVPGPYGSGSAGYMIGVHLNAAVSSRSTFAGGAVASVTAPVTVGGYSTGQDPATLVLDATASAHTGVNTVGERVYAAGGQQDPLGRQLPGPYGSGSLGYFVGTRLDVLTSSRLPTSEYASAPTIVDKFLGRNLAGGSDGGRTVQDALRATRNKVAFDVPVAGQFTVYKEDDTTVAWTGTYTSSAGANPVTAIDPS